MPSTIGMPIAVRCCQDPVETVYGEGGGGRQTEQGDGEEQHCVGCVVGMDGWMDVDGNTVRVGKLSSRSAPRIQ